MRRTVAAALAVPLALSGAPLAFAQEEGQSEETPVIEADGDAPTPEGAAEAPDAAPPAPGPVPSSFPKVEGARESAPGETHTVVKGDTLWDLSQKFLGSPWYWPKVWSYNPEIANPHWIYPGNMVRFFNAGEEAPARVDVAAPGEATSEGGKKVVVIGGETSEASATGEDVPLPTTELLEDSEQKALETSRTVQVAGQIGYKEKDRGIRVQRTSFVTVEELTESGAITGTFAEKLMLSPPDTFYVKFAKPGTVRVGGEYQAFHTAQAILHPVTGKKLGFVSEVDGVAKVVSIRDGLVTAQLLRAFSDVQVGQRLGASGEKFSDVIDARPNPKDLVGMVVGTLEPGRTLLAEHHYILIDKGTADGVERGNTFVVMRRGGGQLMSPERGQNPEFPPEPVGRCVVADVKPEVCTCVVVRSLREMVAGDRAEMRANTKAATVSSR
ncbi:MAG: LysM peptidoglycan-binding domain-containing protein [Deltaproteobacteria bacterium]|nr:LysM peptidoglycan-binding domain-containing protein [Deltaproteobacteria bacterium]